jgi:hypothetical protein
MVRIFHLTSATQDQGYIKGFSLPDLWVFPETVLQNVIWEVLKYPYSFDTARGGSETTLFGPFFTLYNDLHGTQVLYRPLIASLDPKVVSNVFQVCGMCSFLVREDISDTSCWGFLNWFSV